MRTTKVTQYELEGFKQEIEGNNQFKSDEEAQGTDVLSVADVRARELVHRNILIKEGKITADQPIPSWADIYQTLLNANIRPRIAAYMAWATMPKSKYRYPATQDQMAIEILGLTSDRAITSWRRKYPEIDAMITALQSEEMLEYRPGVIHALGMVASDPSYRANPDRRLFLEVMKELPKQKISVSEEPSAGHKLLDQLKKAPTAKLLEILGADAMEIMKELDEELNPPAAEAASPQIGEHDLGGEDEDE